MDDHALTPSPAVVEAALETVVARTHVRRYRYLVHEQPDERERAKWRAWVVAEAARGPFDAPPSVPVHHGDPSPGPCGGCP